MRCDLHMHSNFSDGRYAPDQVLAHAARGGLEVVALTDHDVVGAVPPGNHEVLGRTVRVIAAVEVSASLRGTEQHLLVYFPGVIPDGFRAFCQAQCRARVGRWTAAAEALGLAIPAPAPEALAGDRALTRFHLAQVLVAAGRCASVHEAFARLIGDEHGTVACTFPDMEAAIAVARQAGGIPVWAHPQRVPLDRHLGELVDAGLRGIEGLRPGQNAAERKFCRKQARKHDLLVTGGSDWHGWSDAVQLGLFVVDHREIEPFLTALA